MKLKQLFSAAVIGAALLIPSLTQADDHPSTPQQARPSATTTPGASKQIPPQLQRSIEAGDAAQTRALAKSLGIAIPPGEPPRHECGKKLCSCSGVEACSTLSSACKKGTIACEGETCLCQKK